MSEEIDLFYLYWIMHRVHMVPVDEYLSLAYIWAREALERYRARDRTTMFSTFLFHFIRCKWSNYWRKKDFKTSNAPFPELSDPHEDFSAVERLADIKRTADKDLYKAAILISEGHSIKEASEMLNMNKQTLYTKINRYRKKEKEYE